MISGKPEFVRVSRDSDAILRNLYEHYVHDMSEWLPLDTHEDGAYHYDTAPLWAGDFAVYFAKVDGALAGFGVVQSAAQWLGNSAARDVKDFCVLRRYRHRGLADVFATHLWNEFPAQWIVRILPTNQPAVSFWRRAVHKYSNGNVAERIAADRGRDWIHLTFDNSR